MQYVVKEHLLCVYVYVSCLSAVVIRFSLQPKWTRDWMTVHTVCGSYFDFWKRVLDLDVKYHRWYTTVLQYLVLIQYHDIAVKLQVAVASQCQVMIKFENYLPSGVQTWQYRIVFTGQSLGQKQICAGTKQLVIKKLCNILYHMLHIYVYAYGKSVYI